MIDHWIALWYRHAYNEFGKGKGDGQSDESMVDPTALFSQLFGGERFQVRYPESTNIRIRKRLY